MSSALIAARRWYERLCDYSYWCEQHGSADQLADANRMYVEAWRDLQGLEAGR